MNNTEMIETITAEVMKRMGGQINEAVVPVGVSNRHIHLSEEDVESLFGKGYKLTQRQQLKQPGQYAAEETVMVIGPKGIIDRVRVLGPIRSSTQLEISQTDSFKLGVKVPLRESGDIDGTPGIVIKGPKGIIKKDQGVILAMRHIHLDTYSANKYGLKDKEKVKVTFAGSRGITFENVLIRVSKHYVPEMHIDIDEANAGLIQNGELAKIVKEN